MNRFFALFVIATGLLLSCGDTEISSPNTPTPSIDPRDTLTLCHCLKDTTNVICTELYPAPLTKEDKLARIDAAKTCGVELTFAFDTVVTSLDSLPEPESVEEILTMEVPDPLSEECQKFLEDYSKTLESNGRLIKKMTANPDNLDLMMQWMEKKNDLEEWASKPQMFECSSNESFKYKVEKLNEQRDKQMEN